jgi:hypothetical protein
MNLFWASFLRHAAKQSDTGSIRQLAGLEAAWVHSAMPINNATYLSGRVENEEELRNRFASAVEDAMPHEQPWAFFLYEPYAASLDPEQVASAAAEFGLANVMGVQVMTGNAESLAPPKRPLPDLEFRRVARREDCWTVF